MSLDWNVILQCCLTIGVLVLIFLTFYYVRSAKQIKRRREALVNILNSLKPGKDIIFSGGIRGTIVRAGEEYLDVEVAKGITITVSRLSVTEVLNKRGDKK